MANRNSIDRAAASLAAEFNDSTTGDTLRELAKSNRLLAKAALVKARGYDGEDDAFEDEVADQQEDDHDEWDEEEDEDQDPDNPDLGSGEDDLRGVVGKKKKGRAAKSRRTAKSRRRAEEDGGEDDDEEKAEDDLVRAKLRLKKAERAEEEAEDAEERDEARKSRRRAEKELNRARGKLRRAKPAWAGDEEEEADAARRRANDWDDVYADGEDSYYTNEDANHEEDEIVPPDGPDVADGDDVDQYTIGAHKVHSKRAMRRSRPDVPSQDALYRSVAKNGRITEDLLDAAPALEEIVELLGAQQSYLAKSDRRSAMQDRFIQALAANAVTQNRAIQKLTKSLNQVLSQPQLQQTPWGLSPQLGVLTGGKDKAKGKLQKSRQDLLGEAEDALQSGMLDADTFQAMGRVQTPQEIVDLAPAPLRQQLGWAK